MFLWTMEDLDPVGINKAHSAVSAGLIRREDLHWAAVVHAQTPLSDVEMMRAPIGHHAAPILAVIAPIWEMLVHAGRAQFGVIGPQRGWPQPRIPVQSRLLRLGWQIAGHTRSANVDLDSFHFPNPAILH